MPVLCRPEVRLLLLHGSDAADLLDIGGAGNEVDTGLSESFEGK